MHLLYVLFDVGTLILVGSVYSLSLEYEKSLSLYCTVRVRRTTNAVHTR